MSNPESTRSSRRAASTSGRVDALGLNSSVIPGEGSVSRRRRKRRVKNLAFLPTMLTFGNGIAGLAAIVELAKAYTLLHATPPDLDLVGKHMTWACVLIGLGMVFDMFDGKVARMTGTAGKFGAELDSLCDVVTFGVAPAFFLRVFGEVTFGSGMEAPPDIASRALWGCSAIYLVSVLFRLARFNVETTVDDNHHIFRGLPSPAGAGGVISLFLFGWFTMGPKDGVIVHSGVFQVLIPTFGIAIGLLMVSRLKYQHVFNRLLSGGRSVPFVLASIVFFIIIYILREHFIPILAAMFILYICSGPALWVWNRARRGNAPRALDAAGVPITNANAPSSGKSARLSSTSGRTKASSRSPRPRD